MKDELIEAVTQEVMRQLSHRQPRALLIGDRPDCDCGYELVDCAPYDAVVIGAVPVCRMLQLDFEPALTALLDGVPVFFDETCLPSRRYRNAQSRALLTELQAAERRLRQYGARALPSSSSRRVITAQQARELRTAGGPLPQGAFLTPLARDILEGKCE